MPELPYEIWCEITGYLSGTDILRMRSVNRHTLNIALSMRYKEGRIHYLQEGKTLAFLNSLKIWPSQASSRLRSLLIRPHALGLILQIRAKKRRGPSETQDAKFLLESLATFSNLTHLDLQCCYTDDYRGFKTTIPYIMSGFESFSKSLTSLRVLIPLEAYRDMNLNTFKLGGLRDLTVDVFTAHHTSDSSAMLIQYLSPFISNHKRSLESLSISSTHSHYNYPLDPLFSCLQDLPHLTNFELKFYYISPSQTEIGHMANFLSKHSQQIRALKISIEPMLRAGCGTPDPAFVLRTPFFSVHLPYLRSLTLGVIRAPASRAIPDILAYISKNTQSLTEFSLTPTMLGFSEVRSMVSGFEGRPLRSLSFATNCLGPDLLTLLSTKLPDLHRLEIYFDTWSGRGVTAPDVSGTYTWLALTELYATAFTSTILDESYSSWNLRHLVVIIMYASAAKLSCRSALAAALPGVVTFNGMDRGEFAKD